MIQSLNHELELFSRHSLVSLSPGVAEVCKDSLMAILYLRQHSS